MDSRISFFLPPSPGDIFSVSVRGPVVVVNVTIYRCDAFIVEPDQDRVVELPDLSLREVEAKCHQFTEARRFQAQSPKKDVQNSNGGYWCGCGMLWHFPSSMHWISHDLRQQMKNGLMCGGFPQGLLLNPQSMRLGITRENPVKR